MRYHDGQIKEFLESHGIAWDQFVLSSSGLPTYQDKSGRPMSLVIEDEALYAAVQLFLIRRGRAERREAPACEVERPFWVTVWSSGRLTPSQLRTLRAANPDTVAESAQSFVARVRTGSEQKLGPFWRKGEADAAVKALLEAGLTASICL